MKAKLWIRLFRWFVKNCTTKNSDGNDTLTVGVVNVTKFCDQVEIEIQQLESELARLRKAIEEAPHAIGCSICVTEVYDYSDLSACFETRKPYKILTPCTCWKRNALEGMKNDTSN